MFDEEVEPLMMKTVVGRIRQAVAAFIGGWSYRQWDPPYPGDGI